MKKITIVCCILTCGLLHAQEAFRKPGIHTDIRMPIPIKNDAFRGSFDALVQANVWGDIRVVDYLYVGIGVGGFYGQVEDRNLGLNTRTNGKMRQVYPFARIAYDKPFNEQFRIGGYAKIGYGFASFSSDYCTSGDRKQQQSLIIEPGVSLGMLVTDNLAINLLSGLTWMNAKYTPDLFCLTNFSGYDAQAINKNYLYFSFGFGASFFLTRGGEQMSGGTGF